MPEISAFIIVFPKKSYHKFRFTVIYNRNKSLLAKPHREDKSNYADGLVLMLQGPLFSPLLIDTKAAKAAIRADC